MILIFQIVSEELTRMEDWVSCHISDYSGFHYRQFLISCFHNPSVLDPSDCPLHRAIAKNAEEIQCSLQNDKKKEILLFIKYIKEELDLLSELQKIFQGHETLWNHRRYILHEINKINLAESTFSNVEKFLGNSSVDDAVQCKRHKLENSSGSKIDWNITKEEVFLKESFQTATLGKFHWEKTLIKRHIEWLQNVLLWPVALSFS